MSSFMGLPIQGDIIRGEKMADQKPMSDLAPLIAEVLAQDDVLRFGWTQYTPYFNDGDACIFGVHGVWADPVGTDEDSDEWNYHAYDMSDDPRWGKEPYRRDPEAGAWIRDPYVGDHESAYRALTALENAMGAGSFDNVLLGAFGDHAEVTVYRDKILVEQYDHD